MTRREIILADGDRDYAGAFLTEACETAGNWGFAVRVFTEWAALVRFLETHRAAVLIVAETLLPVPLETVEARADCRIILTEGSRRGFREGWSSVSRYQSLPDLMRRVMKKYAASGAPDIPSASRAAMTVYGVYAPAGGCLQTSLAVTLGLVLGERCRTLLLNLEGTSGFSSLFDCRGQKDVTDLMGEIADGAGHQAEKLQLLTRHLGPEEAGLDYLPPASAVQDILEAPPSLLEAVVTLIGEQTAWEALVIDFGHGVPGLMPLLMLCDHIWMPVGSGRTAQAKTEEFLRTVRLWSRELAERCLRLPIAALPPCGLDKTPPALMDTDPLGQLVRQQLSLSGKEERPCPA